MLSLLTPDIVADTHNGATYLRSRVPLETPVPHLGVYLARGATLHPDRPLFKARTGEGVQTRTWGEIYARARSIAAHLVGRGTTEPIAVLSDNSIAQAELTLGAMLAGVPVAPISVAYSLRSTDHRRLAKVVDQLKPGTVYVETEAPFERALAATGLDRVTRYTAALLEGLAATPPGAIDDVTRSLTPDTVAKILFTSGSTGMPKGVMTTHRMLCANQQMIAQCWPFLSESPPILVDWLPWNHTFGGSHNFGLVLAHGGTLFIDEGRPVPALVDRTVANLRDTPPTDYFTVPAGYAALVPKLEDDPSFAAVFFSRLRTLFYAGAALPDDLWQRLGALAAAADREVFLTTAWGSTETAPMSTSAHFSMSRAGNIGVPAPGRRAQAGVGWGSTRDPGSWTPRVHANAGRCRAHPVRRRGLLPPR